MVSFPLTSHSAAYSEQKQTTSVSLLQQQEGSATTENSQIQESSTKVELTYRSSTQSQTFVAQGVEKYQAIKADSEPTSAASNILSFINAQIQRDIADGATKEALASRLQAGLDGFLQGFGEAYEQIEAMGMLVDDVKSAVQQTYNDVVAGVAALAEALEIDAPKGAAEIEFGDVTSGTQQATNTPLAIYSFERESQTSSASSYNKNSAIIESFREQQQVLAEEIKNRNTATVSDAGSRDYTFQLTTNDGDVVTINAHSAYGKSVHQDGGKVGYAEYNSDYFNFSVSGELDEGELEAINALLGQVNDVADTFFSGDVYAAYEQLLEVGFNDEEIAGFAFSLTQTRVTQVETAYRDVAEADNSYRSTPNRAMIVGEFVQKLEILSASLKEMGTNFEVAENLLDMIGESVGKIDENKNADKLGLLARRFESYF